MLNKLLGKCQFNDKIDRLFIEYCATLEQKAENVKRKYWEIPAEFFHKNNEDDYNEGDLKIVMHKRRERNRYARNKCIELHGTVCKTCEIDLKDIYGDLAEGYIQVHHIIPISMKMSNYKIDPNKDLIPVCPNCHAMLHRYINGELINPKQLKTLIIKMRKKSLQKATD